MLIRENGDELRGEFREGFIDLCVAVPQSLFDALEFRDVLQGAANAIFPRRHFYGRTCQKEAVAGGSTIKSVNSTQGFPIFQFPPDETSPVIKGYEMSRLYRMFWLTLQCISHPTTMVSSPPYALLTPCSMTSTAQSEEMRPARERTRNTSW
jgi:hypothetical protein